MNTDIGSLSLGVRDEVVGDVEDADDDENQADNHRYETALVNLKLVHLPE
jgi:hypothetical protein